MLKKIIITVIVLLVAGLVATYFTRNIIVEKAVESGGEYALGVQTDLGSAALSVSGGSLELDDFEIANPQGFENDKIFVIDYGMLDVDNGSVFSDEITVDSLVLRGIRINFEQVDKNGNYKVLMDNIKNKMGESSSEGDTKLKIKKVSIRDIEVAASLTAMGKKQFEQTFKVDNITMTDIGGDNGATVAQVTGIIVRELLTRASAVGSRKLSGEFGKQLNDIIDKNMSDENKNVLDKVKDIGGSLLGGDKK